ncbi:MAG: bifunctional folylpolyglutamate synthase/dihydrofolate synthase [Muribaculaceae bacterium]|nr:bifunctional folylpolyglutamate synthase/dihydrofolate synthase [Muribaculaceae bacterium]
MNYQETIDYLYNQRPAFERQGAGGYKPGLQTSQDLDRLFGHPHRNYRIIHVAGTNGKGSVAHMLAAMLQLNGYRVGLFTSPHFVDFRERIRVDGEMITQDEVVQFVHEFHGMNYSGTPSFFELTSTMAFSHFARRRVDVAVIEAGLGGRLDSTNIVTPVLSVITNISLDHTEFLGDTLPQIAAEKAGIIKPGVPVVIGESNHETRPVFEHTARRLEAPITFAQDQPQVIDANHVAGKLQVATTKHGIVTCELAGDYQRHNINTALTAELVLEQIGFKLDREAVGRSFDRIAITTGLMGRWTTIANEPCRTICDSGHNIAGITAVAHQLAHEPYEHLHMVVGFMRDKDLRHILPLLPKCATYYYTQAFTPRALPAHDLRDMAVPLGLQGECYPDVMTALQAARTAAAPADLIYIGGSMYVLAELFAAQS